MRNIVRWCSGLLAGLILVAATAAPVAAQQLASTTEKDLQATVGELQKATSDASPGRSQCLDAGQFGPGADDDRARVWPCFTAVWCGRRTCWA